MMGNLSQILFQLRNFIVFLLICIITIFIYKSFNSSRNIYKLFQSTTIDPETDSLDNIITYWYNDPNSKKNNFDVFQLDSSLYKYISKDYVQLYGENYKMQISNSQNYSILQSITHPHFIKEDNILSNRNYSNSFFQIDAVGRLGNLMFEYAAVVGLCISRGLHPKSCAIITLPPGVNESSKFLPLLDFLTEFNISSSISNQYHLQTTERYSENMFLRTSFLLYDKHVLHLPISTRLQGYFQSYKYFYPHADQIIRKIFQFSSTTIEISNNTMKNIELQMASRSRKTSYNYTLVCMACRRGDKTSSHSSRTYDKWSLSKDYYLQALRMMKQRYGKIAVVIFVGGQVNEKQDIEDKKWVDDNIINVMRIENLEGDVEFFHDEGIEHNSVASLRALSLCPNIIVASSSFSWWSAYLSGHSNIIAPRDLTSSGELGYIPLDYYPPSWTLIHESSKTPVKIFPISKEEQLMSYQKKTGSIGSMFTTVVTSFYIFPEKLEEVIIGEWINNFMKMDFKCIIFVNKQSFNVLTRKWPETNRRKYIQLEVSEFYLNQQNWNKTKQLELDLEVKYDYSWDLYALYNQKIFMVEKVIEVNPFGTSTFAWTDIDTFKDQSLLKTHIGYPDPRKFDTNKVSFPLIYPFPSHDLLDLNSIDNRFHRVKYINGGHFVGGIIALQRFANLYRNILKEANDNNVFLGNDQNLLSFLTLRYPYFFDLIQPECIKSNVNSICIPYNWSLLGKDVISANLQTVANRALVTNEICDAYFLITSNTTTTATIARDNLRRNWINDLASNYPHISFKYKFIVGRDIELEGKGNYNNTTINYLSTEIEYFGDIIVLPFFDTIDNITTKVTLMLKWAIIDSPQCKYFFRLNDNVNIRAYKFHSIFQRLLKVNQDFVYGGNIYTKDYKSMNSSLISSTIIDSSNQSSNKYIPYAIAPFYFISKQLIQHLPYSIITIESMIHKSHSIQELIPSLYLNFKGKEEFLSDDIFLGNLIASLTSIMNISYVNVNYWMTTTPFSNDKLHVDQRWFSSSTTRSNVSH